MADDHEPGLGHTPLLGTLHEKLDTAQLRPLRQGDLDGLCGLYAAVNAIRLVLAPVRRLKRPESVRLFRVGVDLLAKRCSLPELIVEGIEPQILFDMMDELAAIASASANWRITYSQPLRYAVRANRMRMYEAIENAINEGQPMLISLTGRHDHYTVISGYSPFTLRLFDSGDLHFIRRGDCGTQHGGDKWRHRVAARSMTVLCLTSTPNKT